MATQQQTSTFSTLLTQGTLTAAGALIGMSAIVYMQKNEKQKIRSAKIEHLKERKRQYYEKKMMNELLDEAKNGRKEKRRVHLYFDENDEMIEKDDDQELAELKLKEKQLESDKDLNIDDLKKKLKSVQQKQQFKTKITVNLGNEEYDMGKSKITADIFEGNNKAQNAELFIENLQKTKKRHLYEMQKEQIMPSDPSEATARKRTDSDEDLKKDFYNNDESEDVIMDLDVKKFDKKDHIFMDFLSLYGKQFIKSDLEKNKQKKQEAKSATPFDCQVQDLTNRETDRGFTSARDAQTPISKMYEKMSAAHRQSGNNNQKQQFYNDKQAGKGVNYAE